MKSALQVRNKFSFVDGSCMKQFYATSNVLSAQWDRWNAIVLTWLTNYVSQDVYMGLVILNDSDKERHPTAFEVDEETDVDFMMQSYEYQER
ncbi:hypothetical protein Tco_1239785, partial [Tanacetum coccineum]